MPQTLSFWYQFLPRVINYVSTAQKSPKLPLWSEGQRYLTCRLNKSIMIHSSLYYSNVKCLSYNSPQTKLKFSPNHIYLYRKVLPANVDWGTFKINIFLFYQQMLTGWPFKNILLSESIMYTGWSKVIYDDIILGQKYCLPLYSSLTDPKFYAVMPYPV